MSGRYTLVLGLHLLSSAVILKIINFILPFLATCLCSCVSTYILWMILSAVTFQFTKEKFLSEEVETEIRAVFITGCDSGFGHELAKRLDSKGFHVFASCLCSEGEGASELKSSCSGRLRILPTDVRQDESVEKAVKFVKENLGPSVELWAVVNNAGILKGFSVEMSTIEEFKENLDGNFLGPVRVTKAFLPLLKKSKGRIVNVTSAGGEIALPFFTPYTASKFAAVGFTDCLRHEIDVHGVSVVSIEPEIFATNLILPEAINRNLDKKFEEEGCSPCDDGYKKAMKDFANAFLSLACRDTSFVVDDLVSAVSLAHPDHTYKPRRNAPLRFVLFCCEGMPRSFKILISKIGLFIAFSEIKKLKSIAGKIVSLIV